MMRTYVVMYVLLREFFSTAIKQGRREKLKINPDIVFLTRKRYTVTTPVHAYRNSLSLTDHWYLLYDFGIYCLSLIHI